MTNRGAIILAGGKGQRFQTSNGNWQDKALAYLDNKPLIVHAIENIKDVAEEIIVVVNEEARKEEYRDIIANFGIRKARFVTDLKINSLSGPLIAIYTGLKYSEAEYCLTIPSDVPMLNPKVADYLYKEIKESYACVPMWPNGSLETLLMVLNRKISLKISEVLCYLKRNHPDDIIRGTQKTLFLSPLGKIKNLDPELKSFVNVNSQEDLTSLRPRQGRGPTHKNLRLDLGEPPFDEISKLKEALKPSINEKAETAPEIFAECAERLEERKNYFWAALSREHHAKNLLPTTNQRKDAFMKASQNYDEESEIYQQNKCYLLAERAKSDAQWCRKQTI